MDDIRINTEEIPLEQLGQHIDERIYFVTEDRIIKGKLISAGQQIVIEMCEVFDRHRITGAYKAAPCTDGDCTRCALDQIEVIS